VQRGNRDGDLLAALLGHDQRSTAELSGRE
jgi:hypothetical protein